MTDRTKPDHYSYTLYADPETARTFDDRRFGGPIGVLVAEGQARVLLSFAGEIRDHRVLDVGTGTGRAALLLAGQGARVTGVDASEEMLTVARARAATQSQQVEFRTADAQALPFADRSFDLVVSLRVVMHTPRWRDSISELCRVSRRSVILDYPSARSLAALQSGVRRILHAIGIQTEPYRVFSDAEIRRTLTASGFRVRAVDRQFVLPIALHKTFNAPRFTRTLERVLAAMGLQAACGSPVTILAERCEPS